MGGFILRTKQVILYGIGILLLIIIVNVIKNKEVDGVKQQLHSLQKENEELDKALKLEEHQEHRNDKKVDALEKEKERLLKQREDLQRKLQAKRSNVAYASPEPVRSIAGSCGGWMQAAGISDKTNARILIARESGCNPNAVNSSSGACGIGQQLPCGKWPHKWNDPIGGMIDMQNYVMGKYGSWSAAVAHSSARGWY